MVRVIDTFEFDGKLLAKDSEDQLYLVDLVTLTLRPIKPDPKVAVVGNIPVISQ